MVLGRQFLVDCVKGIACTICGAVLLVGAVGANAAGVVGWYMADRDTFEEALFAVVGMTDPRSESYVALFDDTGRPQPVQLAEAVDRSSVR